MWVVQEDCIDTLLPRPAARHPAFDKASHAHSESGCWHWILLHYFSVAL